MERDEVQIGHTVLGRDIAALVFHPPEYARPRPPVLLVAGLHGDDPLGPHCLVQLARELIERPPGRLTYFVPALNLDGLAAGTQNNARDVDLDSNFASADWGQGRRPGHGPGAGPESEPETQALAALLERVGAHRIVLLQSPLRAVYWAGAGQALAAEMAAHSGYPLSRADTRPRAGSLARKYGEERGCELVIVELPLVDEAVAWQESRSALRHAVDLPE